MRFLKFQGDGGKMRHRTVTLLAGVIAATAALSVISASGASAAPQVTGTGHICESSGTGMCLTVSGATGDYEVAGIGQTGVFAITPVSSCLKNGVEVAQVTTNCPFTETSLDSEYLGDPIVELHDNSNGDCVAPASGGVLARVSPDISTTAVAPRVCGTSGYLWT